MLLFLDFDGVLHPNGLDEALFCRATLLWRLLRACPDMKVVFSTSWREIYTVKDMVGFVTRGGGEDLAARFIGKTPVFRDVGNYPRRDIEIQSWLEVNGYSCPWLAIDDMPELFDGAHPHLHVVAGNCGLTSADISAIIEKIQ